MVYIFMVEVEVDLCGIICYMCWEWGVVQVCCYIVKLEQGIVRFVVGEGLFKDMSEFFFVLWMVCCEYYYVFCLLCVGEFVLVVVILYECMDFMM